MTQPETSPNPYESGTLVSQYLLFHYGSPDENLPWPEGPTAALGYAVRTVSEMLDTARLAKPGRALDIGCAVGRSTFELARYCGEVVGIDYSAAFVEAAETIRIRHRLPYRFPSCGEITEDSEATLPEGIDPERVSFEVGDAHDLRDHLSGFDVVHAANLLCRLQDPEAFLERLPGLLKPGGQLILSTPQTWLPDYTPVENWIGGRLDQPSTLQALDAILGQDFERVERRDMPFLIREHRRKFQWSMAEATRWIRR